MLIIKWTLAMVAVLCPQALARNINREHYRSIRKHIADFNDPCDDFYQYACGNWEYIHDSENYHETLSLIDYNVNVQLARILKNMLNENVKEPAKTHMQYKFIRNLLNYYKSCRSIWNFEPAQYIVWLQQHEHISWPSVAKRREPITRQHHIDWLKLLAIMRRYELNGVFIEEIIVQSAHDALVSLVDIDKPVLNGGFQALSEDNFDLVMSGLNVDYDYEVQQLWRDVFAFEKQLQQLAEIEDGTVQLVGYADLKPTWLKRYLSIVLKSYPIGNLTISLNNVRYFNALHELLDNIDGDFVARYLEVRFLWHLHLNGPTDFYKVECVEHLHGMLPLAMDWLYEQHNADLLQESAKITLIFDTLKAEFRIQLQHNTHKFSVHIRELLVRKLDNMKIKIGNLPRHNTTWHLENYYSNLSLSRTNYYGNHLELLNFAFETKHAQILKRLPSNVDDYFYKEDAETAISSSPYYLSRHNIVVVPLTLLHRPIYHANFSDLFKYSSIGFLLAHEMIHGYDESGLRFDKNGNEHDVFDDIMMNDDIEANLECLRYKDAKVIDEKIADVSGIRLAYHTYFDNTANATAVETTLESWTEHNVKQLFFLNFAQFFCGPKNNDKLLLYREHGADHQRVLDALANFDEFGKAYQCSRGSNMRPNRKCQLWS